MSDPIPTNLPPPHTDWEPYVSAITGTETVRPTGNVVGMVGLTVEADGPVVKVGDHCLLEDLRTRRRLPAEVIGFRHGKVLLMPLGETRGIGPGWIVTASGESLRIGLSDQLLGRVVDALGRPLDTAPAIQPTIHRPLYNAAPHPLHRPRITDRLETGVRVIDTLLTLGKGQRIVLFAGSGVGKSTLLGMIARTSTADVNVIALVGERGKEVRDFLDRDMGADALKRSVVVVCTSDQPALLRLKAAQTATTIAEYFRDNGKDVMLLMDSVTRWALAQREVGLAAGEPPTTRGFPPSVFAQLPRLLERAGRSSRGSVTGIYTVLVEGDDMAEPISDTCRAILDGHIVLSRDLAARNHFPAIDVLDSVSRVAGDVITPDEREIAAHCRDIMATYREAEDLIAVGAYKRGSSPRIDRAMDVIDPLNQFLRQGVNETCTGTEAWGMLGSVLLTPPSAPPASTATQTAANQTA